ncbi:MAG: peptidase [Synechococcaceae cyanobacterium]|nr:peptidase [Synechococcaceae cyanobacterium]
MKRAARLLLSLLLGGPAAAVDPQAAQGGQRLNTGAAAGTDSIACASAGAIRPLAAPLETAPSIDAPQTEASPARPPATPEPPAADYRQRLRATPLGWPRLDAWCVQLGAPDPSERRQQACLAAAAAALREWSRLLTIQRVEDPQAAQVLLSCRRPPLERGRDGRSRASRGRALLQVREVQRDGRWRLEPWVQVLIDPGQRSEATMATALHELGHAFGLWGHSDHPGDAMAVQAGPQPVLHPSARDRATLRWLYSQPSRFGQPLPPRRNGDL